MIYAKVIADSISPTGSRLTTVEAQHHRFILAEVNTHRAFSRNSASSRAIPTKKLIEQVRTNPAIPIEFGENRPGMQAFGPITRANEAQAQWLGAAECAVLYAENLASLNVHKQVVNRVLEPFMWHKVIITSTEAGWNNFFEQRISPLAQPEIAALALKIRNEMSFSQATKLGYGAWHLPYVKGIERLYVDSDSDLRKVSAARCARVSYLTHDGKRDIDKDLELYEKLVSADPPHWSPLEHVATPVEVLPGDEGMPHTVGNFDGWDQLRHLPEYQ